MKDWIRPLALALSAAMALGLSGCMRGDEGGAPEDPPASLAKEAPELPPGLERTEDGIPTLRVYDVARDELSGMNIEDYVAGVVAGEMKNDWPLEALKAQAILARTFTLKFCRDKRSKYEGADISTDVAEAQAYAPSSVNDSVRRAVRETRGQVLSADGDYVYAWFHAHSGGMTELPSVALDFKGGDPAYLSVARSEESERAPKDVQSWSATFSREQVARACADAGVKVNGARSVEAGERGDSGRIKTLVVDGEKVSAPSFRIQIGANRLKSTLIDEIKVDGDQVTFAGRGFGHGVGMSQWGAYGMAERGESAERIVERYFPGTQIAKLW